MAKGIYKITNKRTGKSYIGQTNNISRRKQEHMSNLANGTHHNPGMQKDYNRGDSFSFKVLEHVNGTREDLNRREMFQIYKHNTYNNGYNQTHGGDYKQSNQTCSNNYNRSASKHVKKQNKSNGYRRRYRAKQYPIRTYNPSDYKNSGNKWAIYILIGLIILYFISYWPTQFLNGILIIIGIIIVIAIAVFIYLRFEKLYDKYLKRKNIYRCPVCKKRVKFVDGHCPNCYKQNKEKVERAKEIQHNRLAEKSNYKRCPKCYMLINKKDTFCKYCNTSFILDNKDKNNVKIRNEDEENNIEKKKIYYMRCPKCNHEIYGYNLICPNCNHSFKKEITIHEMLKIKNGIKICPNCNKTIPKNAIRCKYCNHYFKTWQKDEKLIQSESMDNNGKIKTGPIINVNKSSLQIGDVGIIISGSLKGQRAKVVNIRKYRNDIDVRLIDAKYPMNISIGLSQFAKSEK